MSRALIVIGGDSDRQKAMHWASKARIGMRIEFKEEKRSLPQNDKMWSMLTEIAGQKEHAGRRYTPDQWKVIFMHACGREVQFIPSLDNATFIPWGQSSSDLSVGEMADLITFMTKWGDENGVVFHDAEVAA